MEKYEKEKMVKGKKRKGKGGSYEKGGKKKVGEGEWVVWGISTRYPRVLYFRVDRESRDVDVAFL